MSMKMVAIAGGLAGALLASGETLAADPVTLDVAQLDQVTAGRFVVRATFDAPNVNIRRANEVISRTGTNQAVQDLTQAVGGVTSFDVLATQTGGFTYTVTGNNARIELSRTSSSTRFIND